MRARYRNDMSAVMTQPNTSRPVRAKGGHRTDIQGLRTVAVMLVLLYHAGVPFFSGGFIGVDVFFVISGFLITGLMLREVSRTGRIDLADFYARRIRRILPAATLVIVVTLVLAMLILPPLRWQDTALEAAAAAAYVANWVFAAGTGYQNAGASVSPLQHFWTLSVEEQFYIVWPLLLIAVLVLMRRKARAAGTSEPLSESRFRRWALGAALLVAVPSLIWAVVATARTPEVAYFVTTTRLWEIAIGALLAILAPQLSRIPARVALVLGYAGAAALVVAGTTFVVGEIPFPGPAALVPTLATAAIIISGLEGRDTQGIGRPLSLRPMCFVGDLSYSLYLWHWPLIVFATALLGGTLTPAWGIVMCALAFAPAYASYRFVEVPFRDWGRVKRSSWAAIRSGFAMIMITVVTAATVFGFARITGGEQPVAENAQGARVLTDDVSDDDLSSFEGSGTPVDVVSDGIAPAVLEANKDNAQHYGDGNCHRDYEGTEPADCAFGDTDSSTEVVLVGDSHAANWAPALIEIAEEQGFKLTVHTKSGCAFAPADQVKQGGSYPECREWVDAVYDEIEATSPDVVITSNEGSRGIMKGGEILPEGERETVLENAYEDIWDGLTRQGIDLVVIADTPEMGHHVPECVSEHPTKLTKCSTPRKEALDEIPRPELDAAEEVDGVEVISMDNWVCPDADNCPAVVGNTLVWRDSHHLTASYSESLADPLAEKLWPLTGIDNF